MDLSIIIVNWKSKDYLRKCVASIFAETKALDYEVIVIDSASFDGSGEMLALEFPSVRFIQSQENLGFSKANNVAFQASTGRVTLFLNPDTELVGPAINKLFTALQELPNVGIVGARLLNTDRSLQTSCVQAFPTILNQLLNAEALRRLTPEASLWGMRALFSSEQKPTPVEMISGACMMMRREVFERIGQFSLDYFMYAEDTDLCFKSQQLGFTNYYVGTAVIVHHGGGSSQQARSNFANVMVFESNSRFLKKWRGNIYSRCYRWMMGAAALVRFLILVILSPVLLVVKGVARWKSACSKWLAIFRWGVGWGRWSDAGSV
ncbi:MAG: glycosyltransferase family 2 protein [Verrucomicrobiota bacterium]